MQLLIVNEPEPKQRKPRVRRSATAVTFRLSPVVKAAITVSAEKYSRSENQQAEFLIKIGYIHTSGINIENMSDKDIIEKFEELASELNNFND